MAHRGRARGIQVVWINLVLAPSSSAGAVRAATLACGSSHFPPGRWVQSLACLACVGWWWLLRIWHPGQIRRGLAMAGRRHVMGPG